MTIPLQDTNTKYKNIILLFSTENIDNEPRRGKIKLSQLPAYLAKIRLKKAIYSTIRKIIIIRIVGIKAHKYGILWNTENGKRGDHKRKYNI